VRCRHSGFHRIDSSYDRRSGVLVFFWTCEGCGARLHEAARQQYRPAYDRFGYERYALVARER
jgi:hypothetical protein